MMVAGGLELNEGDVKQAAGQDNDDEVDATEAGIDVKVRGLTAAEDEDVESMGCCGLAASGLSDKFDLS